eukprot:CAMPEP_0170870240 /NCGR_PEP_ID=MMETSP0734-20130129/24941_1 /TAXON_ID=186038 /ORGANISM="Fragilariopsis kerguelensis, Strain L26-C5" /LENGTH=74 /DNA_ID=CAMNT_0011248973 /DNA_START=375 /DNA_END=599 /DNA_ORIENTATION=+
MFTTAADLPAGSHDDTADCDATHDEDDDNDDFSDNPFLNAATLLPEGVTFDDPFDEVLALGGDPDFLELLLSGD